MAQPPPGTAMRTRSAPLQDAIRVVLIKHARHGRASGLQADLGFLQLDGCLWRDTSSMQMPRVSKCARTTLQLNIERCTVGPKRLDRDAAESRLCESNQRHPASGCESRLKLSGVPASVPPCTCSPVVNVQRTAPHFWNLALGLELHALLLRTHGELAICAALELGRVIHVRRRYVLISILHIWRVDVELIEQHGTNSEV